ncbi:MAG: acyl-CoA thioesterase, partial [Pseudomonas putida]
MSNPTLSVSKFAGLAPLIGGLARSAVLAQLGKLRHGHLRLLCHGQQWSFGDAESLLQAEVEVLVPFFDVDMMEVVWHGHYVKYLEVARCALLDKLGH